MEEEKHKEAETSKAEERQLEAIQRDAPKMAQMREDTDVEDFLGEFEMQMEDLRIPVDCWMRPLLTFNVRDVIAILAISGEEKLYNSPGQYLGVKWDQARKAWRQVLESNKTKRSQLC